MGSGRVGVGPGLWWVEAELRSVVGYMGLVLDKRPAEDCTDGDGQRKS